MHRHGERFVPSSGMLMAPYDHTKPVLWNERYYAVRWSNGCDGFLPTEAESSANYCVEVLLLTFVLFQITHHVTRTGRNLLLQRGMLLQNGGTLPHAPWCPGMPSGVRRLQLPQRTVPCLLRRSVRRRSVQPRGSTGTVGGGLDPLSQMWMLHQAEGNHGEGVVKQYSISKQVE